jgi:GNAT superfamily N-acetyltransferase
MASVTGPIRRSDDLEDVEIRRVPPEDRDGALLLMLTGIAAGRPRSDPAVKQFLRFAREQRLDLTELWTVEKEGRPLTAALIVPSPGRTAMAFLSPVYDQSLIPYTSELIRQACAAQDSQRIRLIQCLLEPVQQLESNVLDEAGFTTLANLSYMQLDIRGEGAAFEPGPGWQVLTWTESRQPLFADAILASYQGTLDCPGLLGLRKIDDIIAGHQATGQFDPDLWLVLCEEDRPAAIMLLTRLPQRQAMELVYLGVSKPWRGQGLARRLVRHALHLAGGGEARQMLLAVDEQNSPAVKLYRDFGFRTTARKKAMILTLPVTTGADPTLNG